MARKTPKEKFDQLVEQFDMPDRMKDLEYDRRGFPIPHVVFRDPETGKPNFVVNDIMVQAECLKKGKCSICGQTLPLNDVWFVGGPKSAYDPRGAYADLPMHYQCVSFALKVCPYLAFPKFTQSIADSARQRLLDQFSEEGIALTDPTVDPTKPELFALVQTTGFYVSLSNYGWRVILNRPHGLIEHWKDGKKIKDVSQEQQKKWIEVYKQDMREEGLEMTMLGDGQRLAHKDGLKGEFPWL